MLLPLLVVYQDFVRNHATSLEVNITISIEILITYKFYLTCQFRFFTIVK